VPYSDEVTMSTADREYSEKRDFIRMTMNAQAQVYLDGDPQPLSGQCSDLSATGMSLSLDRPVPENTELRVVIQSPNEQFQSLDARAIVIRSVAGDDGRYFLGLEIKNLT